jgi:Phage tail tube protein
MPNTTPSNNFIWGLAKQTNESTVATTEQFGMPVFSGRSMPVQTYSNVEVTDASSITGDSYKQGDIHWETDVVTPAFGAALPKLLVGLWPTDTVSGAGPYTHTMSGLGAAPPWFTTYNTDLLGSTGEETFEAGQMSEFSLTGDQEGGPARIGVKYTGKRPTFVPYTNATPQNISTDGYFTFTGGVMKYEVDSGTPVTETNIQAFSLLVSRPIAASPTVDSTSVNYLSLGKVTCTFSMTLLMDDHDAYRATFYGAVGGTTPSNTKVQGSVEINLVHSTTGTHSAKFTIDRAILIAEPPQPDPAASPLTVTINGQIDRAASGDHVKPVVINAIAAAS